MGSLLGGGKKTDNAQTQNQNQDQNHSSSQSGQHGQSSGSGLMGSLGGMFGHQSQSVSKIADTLWHCANFCNSRVETLDIQTIVVEAKEVIPVLPLQVHISQVVQAKIVTALKPLHSNLMVKELHTIHRHNLMAKELPTLHRHSPILKDMRLLTLKDLLHPINMTHKTHLTACHQNMNMVPRVNNHNTVVLNISLHLEMHHNHNIINTQELQLMGPVQILQVDMVHLNINSNSTSSMDSNNINMVVPLVQRCQEECMVVVRLLYHMEAILTMVNTNNMAHKVVHLVATLLPLQVAILDSQDGSAFTRVMI